MSTCPERQQSYTETFGCNGSDPAAHSPAWRERHVAAAVGPGRRLVLGHRALRGGARRGRGPGASGGLHRADGLRSRPLGGVLLGRVVIREGAAGRSGRTGAGAAAGSVHRSAAAPGLEPGRGRDPRLLLSRPGSARARGAAAPGGEGRSEVAAQGAALPRHRPHRHRGLRHRGEFAILSRRAGPARRWGQRELGRRAGAAERRRGRAPAHHHPARGEWTGHRVPGVPRAGRRPPLWQTTVVADPAEGARVLRAHGSPFVSPGVVRLSDRRLGYRRAVLARDPDGHVLQLAGE